MPLQISYILFKKSGKIFLKGMNLIYIGKIKRNLDFSKLLFIDLYNYIYHFFYNLPPLLIIIRK